MKKCKECGKGFYGRQDKIYCSVKCKSRQHYKSVELVANLTSDIDQILHRNYKILKDVIGDKQNGIKIPEIILHKQKFNFNYITNYKVNTQGEVYHYLYDIAWIKFSDNEVLIVKQRKI